MRTKRKLFLFLILFLILEDLQTQWQSDVRLTDDPGSSYLSYNNAKCIASSGSIVHAVWWNLHEGNWEIFYKNSTNNGIYWNQNIRLTNDPANSDYPAISTLGTIVHVVWRDMRDGNNEIYYKRSTNEGLSWEADLRLTNDTANSSFPSVSVSGNHVHIVWVDDRNGNFEVYYKHSTDEGISWGTDVRLTSNTATSSIPSVSVTGNDIHVVWYDQRDGNREIYYKHSSDAGISWGTDLRLTNDNAWSYNPSISADSISIHVVWEDDRDGNFEIYYKRSTDGGNHWEPDTRLTNQPGYSQFALVSLSGSNVHVVWDDTRDSNNEIYYKLSVDGGTSWLPDIRLTDNSHDSVHPTVTTSGLFVHVAWQDYRDGNYEIYYKHNPTGNPIGITNISSNIPKNFSLSQNYPNPFNPLTHFGIRIADFGLVNLKIFDVLGRDVETLVNEELNPGTYEVEWNAGDYPSGVYFYKLSANGYTETRKMVLAK